MYPVLSARRQSHKLSPVAQAVPLLCFNSDTLAAAGLVPEYHVCWALLQEQHCLGPYRVCPIWGSRWVVYLMRLRALAAFRLREQDAFTLNLPFTC